jgi:hypothetical protein
MAVMAVMAVAVATATEVGWGWCEWGRLSGTVWGNVWRTASCVGGCSLPVLEVTKMETITKMAVVTVVVRYHFASLACIAIPHPSNSTSLVQRNQISFRCVGQSDMLECRSPRPCQDICYAWMHWMMPAMTQCRLPANSSSS